MFYLDTLIVAVCNQYPASTGGSHSLEVGELSFIPPLCSWRERGQSDKTHTVAVTSLYTWQNYSVLENHGLDNLETGSRSYVTCNYENHWYSFIPSIQMFFSSLLPFWGNGTSVYCLLRALTETQWRLISLTSHQSWRWGHPQWGSGFCAVGCPGHCWPF